MTAHWRSPRPARTWQAQWIWSDRSGLVQPGHAEPIGAHDPEVRDQRVLFRRVFELDAVPARAVLAATADARYAAYLNGVRIGAGPGRHDANALTYDEWDVAPLLRPGRNVVAVLGRFYGDPVPWWTPSRASHTMGGGALALELEGDGTIIVATDDQWVCLDTDAWTPAAPQGLLASQPAELFDARRFDRAWIAPDASTAGWLPARVLSEQSAIGPRGRTVPGGEPYGAVMPSTRPTLIGEVVEFPIGPLARSLRTTPAASTAELVEALSADIAAEHVTVLDVGRIVAGRLRLAFDGAAGDVVRGGLVEAVGPAAFESGAPLQIVLDDGETTFEPFDAVGGRYLILSSSATGEPPQLVSAEVLEEHRPRHGAHFACSDPSLQRIVDVSLRTVDLSATDAYLDCPTREQRAWTGDAVIHQSVDLVANADWSLAVSSPRLLARPRADGILPMAAAGDFTTPRIPTIPDWSLHWISSVHNLHRYTGDTEIVGELLTTAESVLRWFTLYLAGGRLVDVPGWVLIDWSPVQVQGSSAALTALWARGLKQFADMAEDLGDHGRALWARQLHEQVRAGFGAYWDEERGAYRDNVLPDGTLGTGVSEHVAAAAVLAGLVSDDRLPRVRDLLLDRSAMFTDSPLADHGADAAGPSAGAPVWRRDAPSWDTESLVVGAQPFFRSLVHDAVALLGGDLLPLYRDWERLLDAGPTALRECWEGGSYCHGWSATVARDVIVHTLGVSPDEPGYTRIRIAPKLETLEWAVATVPTPHGDVSIRVEQQLLVVATPVPAIVEWGGTTRTVEAGHHVWERTIR